MNASRWTRRQVIGQAATVGVALASGRSFAQAKEIKIGQTMPYSGPASAYGTIGKVEAAYFKMVNDQGGVNGRKINFITLDDGYSPPKTVEQVRKLVEQEDVLALFQVLGTPPNTAIHKYVNAKKVPHLFVATGATKWNDPKDYPWTFGFNPTYQTEGEVYAKYLLKTKPNAKVAVLYQNDDYGKDYLTGFKKGLGNRANMIVQEATYEVTDPTVDSQVITLHKSGADTFFNITTPKFAAQAIRKVHDIGWKPLHILNNVSASIGSVLKPAGLEKAVDIISMEYFKEPTDPQWKDDPAMLEWRAFMARYNREADPNEAFNVYGVIAAQTLVQVLKQCGNDVTRDNIKRQAENLKNVKLPLLLPGIALSTSPTQHTPIKQLQLAKFDGTKWVLFGEIIGGSAG
ncbi:ABC transporter substrate-binding protein [Ramlibacter albus]|uniref:ABC transporter substrate-binding protein n=1 Tax=Ramlibacter albus TaxID=2079448 RepID=A0A923M606_9BURK|nr:ABC transporter substrate-binding protein [Ramlibacter albus]MBC5763406.1 ABC transporter substrate-binding protein [Ramlibacter albus]